MNRRIERVPRDVGVITLIIGVALAALPGPAGRPAGLDEREARVFGIADLVLVPGLLSGRAPATWMKARAALNVLMAGFFLARVRPRNPRAGQVGAATLGLLTVADGVVASRLSRG